LSNNAFACISLFLGCAPVNRFGDKMTTKGEKIASRFRRGPTAVTTVSAVLNRWLDLAAQHLPGRTGWKAVHEPDPAGVFVGGNAMLNEVA
jgi:hypothetical protein